MDEWSYRLPVLIHYVEYTSPHNEDETLVLWNLTNPQSEQRKGVVKNYFWTIFDVTQADNGYYNFRKKEGTLRSRILLTVKGKTRSFVAES